MRFSKSTEFGIHALWMLGRHGQGPLLVSEMARAQKVSVSYLAKVFQRMAQKGLVRSIRGKRGGFVLARSPSAITLADVIRSTEADEPLFDCLDAYRNCRGRPSCVLRDIFLEAERALYESLENTSLADLLSVAEEEIRPWLP